MYIRWKQFTKAEVGNKSHKIRKKRKWCEVKVCMENANKITAVGTTLAFRIH